MSESSVSNPILWLLVALAVTILLAVTNPSADTMADEYKAKSPLAGAVGLGTLTAQLPEYHSAVLGSYTTAGEETTSIGLLGMVWVVDANAD